MYVYFLGHVPEKVHRVTLSALCHHSTRYEGTRNVQNVLKSNPTKRLKNTNCPFSLTIKIENNDENQRPCIIDIEWFHNHPINSLQVNSFKDILDGTAEKVKKLFMNGFSPGK